MDPKLTTPRLLSVLRRHVIQLHLSKQVKKWIRERCSSASGPHTAKLVQRLLLGWKVLTVRWLAERTSPEEGDGREE